MSDPSNQAKALFLAALEGHAPEQRPAFLEQACAGDAGLRGEVEKLLRARSALGSFHEAPRSAPPETVPEPVSERPGTVIGPYKLVQEIGAGGMGAVWLAQQAAPVQRLVALKVIKPGMDSRQVIARFEAERQALALMDHPNIARVFDAGTTDAGRPYFVMELVKGVPLTRYCDEHRLTPRQRLELFVPVCQALQHAHQKGIIHRDVKPSNVLVALYDGTPVPKVIDFGVAKATGRQLTEHTLVTGFGVVVGTLEYMSPEQAQLNQLDIDTRSDIYSLGVLLYELLTGSTPLEMKRLRQAAMLEVLRLIREEEPPRPSTRLSSTDEMPSVAANRGLEPKQLSGVVRGELDWIVMKALDKDRNRRYETANGFALDVQRYLADEPVQACPPSAWYRFRKFRRRNKTALAVAGLILFFIALLGGGGGWVVRDQAAQQAKAANDLELALDRAELFQGQGKRAEALAALDRAELLANAVPLDPARDERLAAVKERLAAEARDQEFSARFEEIRLQEEAQVNVEENRFTNEAAFPEIREALRQYGIEIGVISPAQAALRIQGRPAPVCRNLVAALAECLSRMPKGDAQTRQWLITTLDAADNDAWRVRVRKAWVDGEWKALEQLAREVDVREQPPSFLHNVADTLPAPMRATRLELLRRTQRAYPADLWANQALAFVLHENGQPQEAIRYYTAALALRPANPGIYLNRGSALMRAGEVDAAIADYRQSVALAPYYAMAHNNLGTGLAHQGQWDEAVAEYREAIRLKTDLPEAYYNLGRALAEKGQLDEAIAAYREVIRLEKDDAATHNGLGHALYRKGQLDEASTAFREAIRIKPDHANAHFNLGVVLADKGRLDKAIAEFREAVRLKKDYAEAHFNLGNALTAKGQRDEAIAAFREAIRIKPDHAEAHCNLGHALRDKGRLDEAIAAFRDAVRLKKDFPEAHTALGTALAAGGLLDEAIAEFREAIRLKKDFAEAHCNLGVALRDKGLLDEAIAACREAIRLKKDFHEAHYNLGNALYLQGQRDEAIAAYRSAVRLRNDDHMAHYALGNALWAKGQLDEAIAACREAIRLKKDFAEAHCNLGAALADKGQLDEAIAAYREALRLKKDYAKAHYNLGNALTAKGQRDEAIAAFREAIRFKEDYAEAHCNLGHALGVRNEFRKALEHLRRGHELGSKNPRWRYPSARWVREYERLVELDGRLPDFLEGKITPASPAERIELAALCSLKRLHRAAARFYEEAFAPEPKLADDPGTSHRYNAACAAALAGCGQGKDADELDGKERARLRRQALDWLRAELNAWGRLLDKEPVKARPVIVQQMQHWLADTDFAGVRGPEALAKMPEAERQPWQKLWDDVADTLARAQAKTTPQKQSDAK